MCKKNSQKKEMNLEETIAGRYDHDKEINSRIEEVIKKSERPWREVMEAFPVYVRRYHLTRFLAYYEFFKMIKDIPGNIVECGIYRGATLFSFGKFLEIFCMGDKARKVIGFDNFEGFTGFSPEDGPSTDTASKKMGGWSPKDFYDEFMELLDIFHKDAFAPWATRIQIVKGNVEETIPDHVKNNPGLRISLLHLDIDLFSPTKTALEYLYPLVVKGGIVVLDEYAITHWAGESKALEEYFGDKIPKLKTFGWVGNPNCYFIKEG